MFSITLRLVIEWAFWTWPANFTLSDALNWQILHIHNNAESDLAMSSLPTTKDDWWRSSMWNKAFTRFDKTLLHRMHCQASPQLWIKSFAFFSLFCLFSILLIRIPVYRWSKGLLQWRDIFNTLLQYQTEV